MQLDNLLKNFDEAASKQFVKGKAEIPFKSTYPKILAKLDGIVVRHGYDDFDINVSQPVAPKKTTKVTQAKPKPASRTKLKVEIEFI